MRPSSLFRVCIAALALTWSASLPAFAQEEEPNYIITDLAGPPSCTARTATRVKLRDLTSNPERFEKQCVIVRGVIGGWSLFDSVDTLYRLSGAGYEEQDELPPGRLGLYPQAIGERFAGSIDVDIIGTVSTCAALYEPGLVMVLGYCHHYGGAYINVSNGVALSSTYPRRLGEEERQRIGNLAFAPRAWADLPVVRDLAQRWLRSIQARDPAAFARMNQTSVEELRVDNPNSSAYEVYVSEESAFAAFRGQSANPQLAVFVPKPVGAVAAVLADVKADSEAYACFCREADCTGRWPIATLDVSNDARRPFVCAHIYRAARDPRRWVVTTSVYPSDFAEP